MLPLEPTKLAVTVKMHTDDILIGSVSLECYTDSLEENDRALVYEVLQGIARWIHPEAGLTTEEET